MCERVLLAAVLAATAATALGFRTPGAWDKLDNMRGSGPQAVNLRRLRVVIP